MGKRAIVRLLEAGYKVRKGRILKRDAKQSQEVSAPVVEDTAPEPVAEEVAAEVVVEEVEEAPKASKPKAKKSYTRKKKSSK